MSPKRCRVGRSPSLRDVCMSDQVKPVESRGQLAEIVHSCSILKKPLVSEPIPPEQPRTKIFSFGSSDLENEIADMKFDGKEAGGFLKACYRCRKRIGEKADVFMYSSFGAFCSPECRAKQIALDKRSGVLRNMEGGDSGVLPKKGAPSKWKG